LYESGIGDARGMNRQGPQVPPGDLVRFALSRQTTQLRKRLGTTWTPRG
jgi:hypothetical protein